jgi:hypothetical protein
VSVLPADLRLLMSPVLLQRGTVKQRLSEAGLGIVKAAHGYWETF